MEINNPHDKFFKETFSNKENVKDLLLNTLPHEISSRIDFESIIISNKGFVDEKLKESFSDLLVQVKLSGTECFVYILVEHKSYPDRFTLFQLIKYMIAIWERDLNEEAAGGTLTPIIPVVFYHGRSNWKYDNNFLSYFPQNDFL